MSRRKRSLQNAVIALLSELVVALVGILLPQALILNYGSRANGLITSLQQLMQYFTLIEGGLFGAAIFALYKPLADDDTQQIKRILSAVRRLYTRVGVVYVLVLFIAAVPYPFFIADSGYPYWVVMLLFCLIGLNGATQMFFIGKYKVLLSASQNNRYVVLLNAISTILFSVVIIAASYCHVHILAAVLLGSMAYLFRAFCFWLVTRKLYPAYDFQLQQEPYAFQNQREVFVQQVLSMLVMNACILLLSFSRTDMGEISVFTVYNMVLTAVFMLTNTVPNGVSASFGDLIARRDKQHLQRVYAEYELLYQVFWTVVFACVSTLYAPFMTLYTTGITDADYVRPALCVLFSVMGGAWAIRIQQSIVIVAAGKYKEIQKNSIVEAVLAVLLPAVGLYMAGLEGMMVGRTLAALYRMVDFIRFSHREVLDMSPMVTVKGIIASTMIILVLNCLHGRLMHRVHLDSYAAWALYAVFVAASAGVLAVIVLGLIYRQQTCELLKRFLHKRGES